MKKWTRALYQPNLPLHPGQYVTASKEHIELSKEAAKEGMVLLKNKDHLLPLHKGAKVALFGKGTFDYVKGGGGSGDVTVSYVRNLYDGFKKLSFVQIYEPLCDFYRSDVENQYANGAAPGMTVEPALTDEQVASARQNADVAIISISRFSGEGWDRSAIEFNEDNNPWESQTSHPKVSAKIFPDGDFYLTKQENDMITKVTEQFSKVVVVLNIGGIITTSMLKENDKITSVMLSWQGGIEGGLATAELLCGMGNPSGKLPDTFAGSIEDYPSTEGFHESPAYVNYEEDVYVGYRYFETIEGAKDKVVYPFGYGLSYTDFEYDICKFYDEEDKIVAHVKVTNIGDVAGKEVIQMYYNAPNGKLQKPARELATFKKTRLLKPGESQVLVLSFNVETMASYDEDGVIAKSAYVLEKGTYHFYIGTDVRSARNVNCEYRVEEDKVVEQLSSKLAPTSLPRKLQADGTYQTLEVTEPYDINECIFEKMIPGTEEGLVPEQRATKRKFIQKIVDDGIHPLSDVAEGKITLDEFIAQLSDDDLIHLLGGQPNTGVSNTFGMGNMPEYGIPNITTADGPAGLRIAPQCGVYTTAWPCATLLASTWNTALVEQVGMAGAREVKENNISMWLTPAVCIHRNPLCGRNFEYYSEDPLLSGKMGAAAVRGIQSENVSACVKHFACNNKETNRKHSDSRVSERALREIYLKQFEVIVKESDPWAIMSSYNAINGRRSSESHELLEDILRGEWGYKGMVTTDWWTRAEQYKEIKAGNDLKMANGFPERVKKAQEMGAIGRADYEHCAKRVLELILKID